MTSPNRVVLTLRVRPSLKIALKRLAHKRDISVNRLIAEILTTEVYAIAIEEKVAPVDGPR